MGGKGAYYKEKYGGGRSQGGGRGGGWGDGGSGYEKGGGGYGGGGGGYGKGKGSSSRGDGGGRDSPPPSAESGGSKASLLSLLRRIDGRPYGAYRDLEGSAYDMGAFHLVVQRAQSDPFAPPSRCYVYVPLGRAGFPSHCFASKEREVAFRDYITRRFYAAAHRLGESTPDTTAFRLQREWVF